MQVSPRSREGTAMDFAVLTEWSSHVSGTLSVLRLADGSRSSLLAGLLGEMPVWPPGSTKQTDAVHSVQNHTSKVNHAATAASQMQHSGEIPDLEEPTAAVGAFGAISARCRRTGALYQALHPTPPFTHTRTHTPSSAKNLLGSVTQNPLSLQADAETEEKSNVLATSPA